MNLSGLVLHGVKSLIEYGEELVLVFLRLFVLLLVVFVILAAYALAVRLLQDSFVPGWASTLTTTAFVGTLSAFGFFVMGSLLLRLSGLSASVFTDVDYRVMRVDGRD